MKVALVDAGPLVALYDTTSFAHQHYLGLIANPRIQWHLSTTWPCVVEACHFLRPESRWQLLRWIAEGAISIFPFDTTQVPDMLDVMRRYTEPPRTDMDFADATLYWLAAETGITAIMTLDVRDFLRYRLPDGRGFEIL